MPAGVPPEEVEDVHVGCYREGEAKQVLRFVPNSAGLQGFLDGYTRTHKSRI